jgi:hypothetical protein
MSLMGNRVPENGGTPGENTHIIRPVLYSLCIQDFSGPNSFALKNVL